MVGVGEKAPEFRLLNDEEKEVKLSDYLGKKVIVYFYSKDNTAGCNKQACGFGELYPHFREEGVEIIGISKDLPAAHRKFREKFQLPFVLLSDPEHQALEAYGVWVEKNMYGKKVMGVIRSSFLIDEEGVIVKAFGKVKPEENARQMLGVLDFKDET